MQVKFVFYRLTDDFKFVKLNVSIIIKSGIIGMRLIG